MRDFRMEPLRLKQFFEESAKTSFRDRWLQRGFRSQLVGHFRERVEPELRVLECGCGDGEILGALAPSRGVGIDFSETMIARAKARHAERRELEFRVEDAGSVAPLECFDHIVLDYLTGFLPDLQRTFERLRGLSHPRTRLHITSLNTLWLFPLRAAARVGLVGPQPLSNWLSHHDLFNLLELSGWEVVRFERIQLFPIACRPLEVVFNRFVRHLPVFRQLGVTLAITARPRLPVTLTQPYSCTVVVPARNESGNIAGALARIPRLGGRTEVIFVEGHSSDDTWRVIQDQIAGYRGLLEVRAVQQTGKGKWNAVELGLELAKGDVVVIQDADLTAPPEDLPKFFDAIVSGTAEFANGSRLVYPMESRAMQPLNLLGNKFFSLALSYVLGQPIKDSLCGTKMLLRSDYMRVKRKIGELGAFDPFGDFNLLFGSALLDLRIRDIPVRYKDRTYGETNISRFRHGWLLLKMVIFGLRRIKFSSGARPHESNR